MSNPSVEEEDNWRDDGIDLSRDPSTPKGPHSGGPRKNDPNREVMEIMARKEAQFGRPVEDVAHEPPPPPVTKPRAPRPIPLKPAGLTGAHYRASLLGISPWIEALVVADLELRKVEEHVADMMRDQGDHEPLAGALTDAAAALNAVAAFLREGERL